MSPLKIETPTRTVQVEDVDDIIGIAAEMKEADADRLTVEELEEVARELDIPKEYVQRAIETLTARREAAREAENQAVKRRKQVRIYISIGVTVLIMILAGLTLLGQASLRSTFALVEQNRAQVQNVIERRVTVEALYEGQPATPQRDAELAGASNRVHIERMRYDEAATAYNAAAGGFPGRLWILVFGLPERVPLSNEIDEW